VRRTPTPLLKKRAQSKAVLEAAERGGFTPLQARVLAGRLGESQAKDLASSIRPAAADLDAPDSLPDIDAAANRLADAIETGERILPCTDHDVDGVTSHAIIRAALIDVFHHPVDMVHSFISHRIKEGYGISEGVVSRIAAAGHRGGVLLSADQGSSDEPRIAKLKALGIETIVTDHHGVEGKGPVSAYAVVNPTREDSRFPDKTIAGCHTAWLTMAATRKELIRRGRLPDTAPQLSGMVDILALGVVADCVDMGGSRNNRLLVQRGLAEINRFRRPCWEALRQIRGKSEPFTAEDLAFLAGPMINARGRLDEAMAGVRFLRSQTIDQATRLAKLLQEANEERKVIERHLKEEAIEIASRLVESGAEGLAIRLDNGHSGVHGIVASRVVEAFGRPTVCLSPKAGHPGVYSGSCRTIRGFHVRNALAEIAEHFPDILMAWGGHAGAGGLTLHADAIDEFTAAWDEVVRQSHCDIGPSITTDGPLGVAPDLNTLAELSALGPYGNGFEIPVFSERAQIVSARQVGDGGLHAQLKLEIHGRTIPAIWFNVPESGGRIIEPGRAITVAFNLATNEFRGDISLQAQVRGIWAE